MGNKKVLTKVLCKRSLVIGDTFYIDEMTGQKTWRDNRMLVSGDWYKVIYNKHDTEDTFTIEDNQGKPHLFYMYGDENDNNYNLPRTYSKWFYTPNELEKKSIREIKKAVKC